MAFQRKNPAAIGVKAPFPGFVDPELATSVGKVPSGKRWVHDIKFDGYRVQVHLRDAAVKVFRGMPSESRSPRLHGGMGVSRTGYPLSGTTSVGGCCL